MAVRLVGYDVSDLCLGKPPIRSLPAASAISHALASLSHSGDLFLSVWSCSHSDGDHAGPDCRCLGKVGMVDIICFLCRPDNISHPISALSSPLSVLLPPFSALVRHVEPHCSLMEALELFLEGAQNLVVPITPHHRRGKPAAGKTRPPAAVSGKQYCWLTQEDMVRFLLNSIAQFSSISALSVDALGIVRSDGVPAVGYHDPAAAALDAIAAAHASQTSVAVLAPDGALVGEISPSTIAACDASVAPALLTLSAGNLMAYIDCGGPPPEELVRAVKSRLKKHKTPDGMLDLISGELAPSSSSSDEDEESCSAAAGRRLRRTRSASYSARMGTRGGEAIVCSKGSSLVAVMMQALAHRVNYVWAVDEEYRLAGVVTFSGILRVFSDHFQFGS